MMQTAVEKRSISEPWRNPNGTFGANNPGRPVGALGKRGKAEIDRLHQRSEAVWRVIDQRLAENCVKTALFLAARMLPAERVVEVPTDARGIADAIAAGDLTPTESNRLALALRSLSEAENVDALRSRLDEIEKLLAVQGRG